MNVSDLVRASAAARGEQPAVVFHDHPTTYADLDKMIDRAAAGFSRLGVSRGDRVALLMHNSLHFVLAYFAILRAGGAVVPMNTGFTAEELAFVLADSGTRALVADAPYLESLSGIRETLPALESVVVPATSAPVGAITWDQMVDLGGAAPKARTAGKDLALVAYTSGTTGKPKGAMLTHANLVANIEQMARAKTLRETPDDVILAVLPLFHIYGLNSALCLAMRVGASVVLLERFDPAESLEAIGRHGVTVVFGAPPMFVAWANLLEAGRVEMKTVRLAVSGAAPLPAAVLERFESQYGVRIWEGYGITEASPVVASNAMCPHPKPASVGKPLPGVKVRLVDADGREVEHGDPGEVLVRGDNVFAGYWNRSEETQAVLRGGWFATGDVAYADDEGYLFLVDRKKDLIIVSGFNVYPREVEEVLARSPKVAEAAVVGEPHPYTGEAVKAFVVLRPGEEAAAEELIEHCRKSLARFKCPQAVEFVDELPHLATGKIARRALRHTA
ncbi:MAG: long-chain fatty acid--CoA ligase [Actinomycetota bacterium]